MSAEPANPASLKTRVLDTVLAYGVQTAWKYGLDTSFGAIQTICAVVGVVGMASVAKKAVFPNRRPIEPLYNRLRTEGGPLAWPHLRVRFATSPYRKLSHKRAVIVQGRTQEGKTTLLRTMIPWQNRWDVWPLRWICWQGIYLNGAEGIRTPTLQQWVTFQMFGLSTKVGSEVKSCIWEYRKSQWFRLFMEKLRMPFLLPRPVYIIVDQFEELMRRFPDEAVAWADALTYYHTRNNVARLIFVVNSENGELMRRFPDDAVAWADSLVFYHTRSNVARVILVVNSENGASTLENLNYQGHRFHRVVLEPNRSEDLWKLSRIDRKLFDQCESNVGLYTRVVRALEAGQLTEADVPVYAQRTLKRWFRDLTLPYPLSTHPSWLDLDLPEAKLQLLKGLEVLLNVPGTTSVDIPKVRNMLNVTDVEIKRLDSTQLFDTTMAEWFKILSNQGSMRMGLSLPEAKIVAKHIRRLMGYPVDWPGAQPPASKPKFVLLPRFGLVPKSVLQQA